MAPAGSVGTTTRSERDRHGHASRVILPHAGPGGGRLGRTAAAPAGRPGGQRPRGGRLAAPPQGAVGGGAAAAAAAVVLPGGLVAAAGLCLGGAAGPGRAGPRRPA